MDGDPLFERADAALRDAFELIAGRERRGNAQLPMNYVLRKRSDRAIVDLIMAVHPHIVERWLTTADQFVRSAADLHETILAARARARYHFSSRAQRRRRFRRTDSIS